MEGGQPSSYTIVPRTTLRWPTPPASSFARPARCPRAAAPAAGTRPLALRPQTVSCPILAPRRPPHRPLPYEVSSTCTRPSREVRRSRSFLTTAPPPRCARILQGETGPRDLLPPSSFRAQFGLFQTSLCLSFQALFWLTPNWRPGARDDTPCWA